MPNSPIGWLGFSMVLAILIAILLGSVGCILYYVPDKMGQGQRLMRSSATVALGTIFVAGLFGAISGRNGVDWGRAVLVVLIAGITFGGPAVWKRLTGRN
jgi:hypothetical protein